MRVELRRRCGGAEIGHADEAAVVTEPFVPTLSDAGLDCDAGLVAQNLGAIVGVLSAEQLHRRHGDDGGLDAFVGQLLCSFGGERQLRTGADERHVAAAFRLGENVCALGGQIFGRWRLAQIFDRLTRQRENGRVGVVLQRDLPAFGRFEAFGRAHDEQMRDGAQCGEVLDRLMGRAVLAEADAVVRHDVNDALAHQRRQADRWPAVVGEDEERAAVRDETARQRDTVHRSRHAVLTHAIVNVVAGERARRDGNVLLGARAVRAGEIGRATDQFGQCRHDVLDRELGPDARRALGLIGGEGRLCGGNRLLDGGELIRAGRHGQGLGGSRAGLVELLFPKRALARPALSDAAPSEQHWFGDLERRGRPAELFARAFDFFVAQRLAVRRRLAGLRRRAIADGGLASDEPGLGGIRAGSAQCGGDRIRIVAVDLDGVPARGLEAGGLVVGDRQGRRPVDRDAIVVEEDDELAEAQMACERDRFLADAFHEAAVASDHVGVVVDDVVAEPGIEQALRQRHADRGGDALAERAGGRLDAGGVAELGMAGGLGAELAEALEVADLDAGIAGEVKQRIEQHRSVPGREHEAVAVGPLGIGGVEAERLAEQDGGDIGHAHRHSRVAGLGSLHGVH